MMAERWLLVLYFLTLPFIFLRASSDFWSPNERVLSVQPVNPYVLIGENLTLTCNVDSGAWLGSTLYFTHKGQLISTNYWRSIGPNSIQLDYPITSPDDQGNYACKAQKNGLSENEWQVLEVEYPPQKVENFSCQIDDYDVSIFCDWDLGTNYIHPADITVSFLWMYKQDRNNYYDCPQQNKTSCFWETDADEASFDRHPLLFIVNVVNTIANKTATYLSQIDETERLVKPEPLAEFQVHPVNSTCLEVNWSHRRVHRKKVYRMQFSCYKCDWDNTTTAIVVKDSKNSLVKCGLNPYTNYTVTGSVKPEIEGFWSEKIEKVQLTSEDVPGGFPEITSGSMSVNSELCKSFSFQEVDIFWKSLPKKHQHGKLLGYSIKYNSSDHNIMTVQTLQTQQSLTKLRCDEAYDVKVYAYTQVGSSVAFALFRINAFQSIPPVPNDVRVEYASNSTQMFVRWTVPDIAIEQTIIGFTVYWCHQGAHMTCQNDISWKIVQENSTTIPITPVEVTNYLYGVSMETSRGSSGFQWGVCIYKSDKFPPEPPERFRMNNFQHAESLSVTWDISECYNIQESAFIYGYLVSYCKASIHNNCTGSNATELNVGGKLSSYTITGLEAGMNYCVSLRALSEAGQGPETECIFGIPSKKSFPDSTMGWIIGIVVACLIIVAIVTAVIIYRCYRINAGSKALVKINPDVFDIANGNYDLLTETKSSILTQFTGVSEEAEQNVPVCVLSSVIGEERNNLLLVKTQISKDSGRSSLVSDDLPASPTLRPLQCVDEMETSQQSTTTWLANSSQPSVTTTVSGYLKLDMLDNTNGLETSVIMSETAELPVDLENEAETVDKGGSIKINIPTDYGLLGCEGNDFSRNLHAVDRLPMCVSAQQVTVRTCTLPVPEEKTDTAANLPGMQTQGHNNPDYISAELVSCRRSPGIYAPSNTCNSTIDSNTVAKQTNNQEIVTIELRSDGNGYSRFVPANSPANNTERTKTNNQENVVTELRSDGNGYSRFVPANSPANNTERSKTNNQENVVTELRSDGNGYSRFVPANPPANNTERSKTNNQENVTELRSDGNGYSRFVPANPPANNTERNKTNNQKNVVTELRSDGNGYSRFVPANSPANNTESETNNQENVVTELQSAGNGYSRFVPANSPANNTKSETNNQENVTELRSDGNGYSRFVPANSSANNTERSKTNNQENGVAELQSAGNGYSRFVPGNLPANNTESETNNHENVTELRSDGNGYSRFVPANSPANNTERTKTNNQENVVTELRSDGNGYSRFVPANSPANNTERSKTNNQENVVTELRSDGNGYSRFVPANPPANNTERSKTNNQENVVTELRSDGNGYSRFVPANSPADNTEKSQTNNQENVTELRSDGNGYSRFVPANSPADNTEKK